MVDVCDVRELGRWSGASEDRLGLTVEVVGFGLEAVDARRLLVVDVGLLSASCFARDVAVGAVRWDGSPAGFVGSLGFGLDVVDVDVLSAFPVRAIDAAVGAVKEVRLTFLSGALAGMPFGDSVLLDFRVADVGVLG